MNIVDRFLKYVSLDTQSDPNSDTFPTTLKQLELANYLVFELHQLGIDNAHVDEYGIVYARINGNVENVDAIGLIAHIDTSPDSPGHNINPQIITKYDGKSILLNKQLNIKLDPTEFENLNEVIGHDLITTDGTTLLGADDKAGIAVIMDVAHKLMKDDSIKHGDIAIAFTPDEEVGKGVVNFDVEKFNAVYAYTIDGGSIHKIGYQNFNAGSATVTINGKSVHPGDAKNKMVNSLLVAMEFESMLPVFQKPQYTENYEGFIHLHDMQGSCLSSTLEYIIRDHDLELLNNKIHCIENVATYLNDKYGYNVCELVIERQYLNMYEVLKNDMISVERLQRAYKSCNIHYSDEAIRGGTDGARLSFMNLPCPNIGAGGFNFHGCFEFLSIDMMKQSTNIILEIIKDI